MTYKGKVDWWIGIAIIGGIVAPVVTAISLRGMSVALSFIFPVFILVCLYPQKYQTSGDALRIRAGLTTRTILWPAITMVSSTTDGRNSLALSLDRVRIEHAGGEIMIAPDDQVRFFDDVASHCPQLSRRGMDLVVALN